MPPFWSTSKPVARSAFDFRPAPFHSRRPTSRPCCRVARVEGADFGGLHGHLAGHIRLQVAGGARTAGGSDGLAAVAQPRSRARRRRLGAISCFLYPASTSVRRIIQGIGAQGSGHRAHGAWIRAHGSGHMDHGTSIGAQGSGHRDNHRAVPQAGRTVAECRVFFPASASVRHSMQCSDIGAHWRAQWPPKH